MGSMQVYPTGQPAELYTWNDMYLGWQQATEVGKHLVVYCRFGLRNPVENPRWILGELLSKGSLGNDPPNGPMFQDDILLVSEIW